MCLSQLNLSPVTHALRQFVLLQNFVPKALVGLSRRVVLHKRCKTGQTTGIVLPQNPCHVRRELVLTFSRSLASQGNSPCKFLG